MFLGLDVLRMSSNDVERILAQLPGHHIVHSVCHDERGRMALGEAFYGTTASGRLACSPV